MCTDSQKEAVLEYAWSQPHIDVTADTKYYDRATQLYRIKKVNSARHMTRQEVKTSIIL